jgi:hypothetical protein
VGSKHRYLYNAGSIAIFYLFFSGRRQKHFFNEWAHRGRHSSRELSIRPFTWGWDQYILFNIESPIELASPCGERGLFRTGANFVQTAEP